MSLDPNSVSQGQLLFIDTNDQVRGIIDYDIFVKYSSHFEDVIWDDPLLKKISIPTLVNFNEHQVIEHLTYILECLQLPIPTLTTPVDNLTPGITRVNGNVVNLKIYLLLLLGLQIDIFINEVIMALKIYLPTLEEIPTYFHIYTDILRYYAKDGYPKIIIAILNNTGSISEELYPIIDTIIASSAVSLYDRCQLSLKVYGYDKTFTYFDDIVDKVDPIVARKIYNLIGVKYASVRHEVDLIRHTRGSVADSIEKYGEAVRISSQQELFYFYVNKLDINGNIDVGNVTVINGDLWQVSIKYKHLFTVDDLKSYDEANSDVEVVDSEIQVVPLVVIDREKYVNAQEYHTLISKMDNVTMDTSTQTKYVQNPSIRYIQNEDTKFRQRLNDRNLLSITEKTFLAERQRLNTKWPLSIRVRGDADTKYDLGLNNDDIDSDLKIDTEYINEFKNIKDKEETYYQSQEGLILEQRRQSSRDTFFASSDRYGGLIIVLLFYNVVSIDFENKRILISDNLFEPTSPTIYHTLSIPKNLSIGTSQNFNIQLMPRYRYIKYKSNSFSPMILSRQSNILHVDPYLLLRDEDGSILIRSPRNEESIEFVSNPDDDIDTDVMEDVNDPMSTFFIIDPSNKKWIDEVDVNLEDLKADSNPLTGTAEMPILAYPYNNPKIYIIRGVKSHPAEEYIWYSFNGKGDIIGFTRSQYPGLPNPIVLVT
jgi:hypothetical protein